MTTNPWEWQIDLIHDRRGWDGPDDFNEISESSVFVPPENPLESNRYVDISELVLHPRVSLKLACITALEFQIGILPAIF